MYQVLLHAETRKLDLCAVVLASLSDLFAKKTCRLSPRRIKYTKHCCRIGRGGLRRERLVPVECFARPWRDNLVSRRLVWASLREVRRREPPVRTERYRRHLAALDLILGGILCLKILLQSFEEMEATFFAYTMAAVPDTRSEQILRLLKLWIEAPLNLAAAGPLDC